MVPGLHHSADPEPQPQRVSHIVKQPQLQEKQEEIGRKMRAAGNLTFNLDITEKEAASLLLVPPVACVRAYFVGEA